MGFMTVETFIMPTGLPLISKKTVGRVLRVMGKLTIPLVCSRDVLMGVSMILVGYRMA